VIWSLRLNHCYQLTDWFVISRVKLTIASVNTVAVYKVGRIKWYCTVYLTLAVANLINFHNFCVIYIGNSHCEKRSVTAEIVHINFTNCFWRSDTDMPITLFVVIWYKSKACMRLSIGELLPVLHSF